MRVIVDPNGTPTDLLPDSRVRFMLGERAYIEVYPRDGSIVLRSDGWKGPLQIKPCVSNEIEISSPE